MICSECRIAAEYNTNQKYVFAENFHKNCEGDCGCLHKTGPGWFVKPNEKAPLMQVQSP